MTYPRVKAEIYPVTRLRSESGSTRSQIKKYSTGNKSQDRNEPQIPGKAWQDNSPLNRPVGLTPFLDVGCFSKPMSQWNLSSKAVAQLIRALVKIRSCSRRGGQA